MNEFWLIGAIFALIVFLIFLFIPAEETKIIDLGFGLGDVFESKVVRKIIWIFRILSLLAMIGFILLYFL